LSKPDQTSRPQAGATLEADRATDASTEPSSRIIEPHASGDGLLPAAAAKLSGQAGTAGISGAGWSR
jgi:hypothetical protein